MSSTITDDKLVHLKLSEITVIDDFNPRSSIDGPAFDSLCESVKQDGVLTPVLVTTNDDGKYVLVAGNRRHAAAVKAKLATIPALVRESINGDAKALAVVENLQRDDLNPIDEATGFRDAMEALSCNQAELAKRLSISQAKVSESLRLLTLPDQVRSWVADGSLPAVVGKALAKVTKFSEPVAVHTAYWCAMGELEATGLDGELSHAISSVCEWAGDVPEALPEIGFVTTLCGPVYINDFDFGEDEKNLHGRYESLRAAYLYPSWSLEDVDAARAFGCLLEVKHSSPYKTSSTPFAFDHDFVVGRLETVIEAGEKELASRQKAQAKALGAKNADEPLSEEEVKQAAREERQAKESARQSAHVRNKDIGGQVRLKHHKTALSKERVEAFLIGFVEGNDDLASAGIALCDDRLIEEENIERKNGNHTTRVTVLDRADAHHELIDRIRKAKTVEEKFGVVWQAMMLTQLADQSSRPDSDRRGWSLPGRYGSTDRNVLPAVVAKDAAKFLPEGERSALQDGWSD